MMAERETALTDAAVISPTGSHHHTDLRELVIRNPPVTAVAMASGRLATTAVPYSSGWTAVPEARVKAPRVATAPGSTARPGTEEIQSSRVCPVRNCASPRPA